jgi:hypothetical protein
LPDELERSRKRCHYEIKPTTCFQFDALKIRRVQEIFKAKTEIGTIGHPSDFAIDGHKRRIAASLFDLSELHASKELNFIF